MKIFFFLPWIIIVGFFFVLRRLSCCIDKKESFGLDRVVSLLRNKRSKQSNGEKWKIILLIMMEISFTFILIGCGVRGPLCLSKNIHTSQQSIQNEN
ncbi:hypothetical protein CEAn_00030 [Coxiella endosymbiont of Amblyomma nuttalli]|nr:hypothetical protein CEAn_00030 [Coxiella endosymbiont of Amblyomma nuttalli]